MTEARLNNPLEHLRPELRDILERLPRHPGVYLLRDREDEVVYVGKAKNLFARVRSYFTRSSGDTRAFVPLLAEMVGRIETIVTQNEKEALLLENTLIKEHRPRFNVTLRDDKSFPVLRLDLRARYPRLEIVRRIGRDGARYFGPYHSAAACRQTLRLVNRYFQLRTCSDRTMCSRKRPCLQCQIARCLAPCVRRVDPAQYAQQVEDVTLFLRGRGDELIRHLERRMAEAAERLDFEHAARIRDQIWAVRSTLESQQVVAGHLVDQDVFGFHREGDRVELSVLMVRAGKLVGRRVFGFSGQEMPDEEILSSFINQYYDRFAASGDGVPAQLLVPLHLEDAESKRAWLSDLRQRPVRLLVPRRGSKVRLLELAAQNARSSMASRRQHAADVAETLAKLQRRLRLTRLPRRIECYDISGFHGDAVVGSMAVLVDGEARRQVYRRFKIRAASKDDFASLYEVLSRRLRRARTGEAGWELPDLIVVDGGRAQLSMALAALRDVGLPADAEPPDVIALAKQRAAGGAPALPRTAERERSRAQRRAGAGEPPSGEPDRVFVPRIKDPIRLRVNTAELYLLSRVRDEAHRFAIAYHSASRRRRAVRSSLEAVPGIGPQRRQKLLRALGSLQRIREASVDELTAVPGMSQRAAEAVARYFGSVRPAPAREETSEVNAETGEDAGN